MEQDYFAENLFFRGAWRKRQTVCVRDGVIASVTEGEAPGAQRFSHIVPGLFDLHIHGGEGFGIADADFDGMCAWLLRMAKHGVAGVLACPYGNFPQIRQALAVVRRVTRAQKDGTVGGARLVGVHLEGPFLSPARPGAIEPGSIQAPTVDAYRELTEGYRDLIRVVTLAPEEDRDLALTKYLAAHGIRVQAGHTDCDYETALAAFAAGVTSTCHTFNAMRPLRHRDPSLLCAALTDRGVYCEMISDLVHLHPGTVRLLHHCKGAGRLMIVSDAVSTTGRPDGIYLAEDGSEVEVKDGASRLRADGTLDGGGCFLGESVRRLTGIGLPFEDCLRMASVTPAARLGCASWKIRAGCPARLTCCREGKITKTVIGCEEYEVIG